MIFSPKTCTQPQNLPPSPIIGKICHYKYSREFLLDYCSAPNDIIAFVMGTFSKICI